MKFLSLVFAIFFGHSIFAKAIYDFKLPKADGGEINFADYKGKVILLTNIATRCGFTDQLDDLEKVYAKYKDKGLVVLGIPSNNFLSQTPEENKEVAKFCQLKYNTNFPISEKFDVIGSDKNEVIKWVHDQKGYGFPILWNFEKFIIGKNGEIIERFRSKTRPLDPEFIAVIEKALK